MKNEERRTKNEGLSGDRQAGIGDGRLSAVAGRRSAFRPRPSFLVLRSSLFGLLVFLASCSIGTPGLPRVWPGQSVSPNVQARSGDIIRLTIRATNESSNRDFGGADPVRVYTAYPEGVTILDFTSSDAERLPADDPGRAWVQEIDTKNRVAVISFNAIGALEQKTATLTMLVTAPPGATLDFRTMLVWSNVAPDQIECDAECAAQGLELVAAADPQVAAYLEDHDAELRALIATYQGGGQAVANPLVLAVGDAAISDPFPRHALLVAGQPDGGMEFTARAAFTPDEPIMLWYNLPDGTATFLFRTDALPDGSVICGLGPEGWRAIPPNATSIIARGQYSGVEAVYLFNR
jgi:hypothetical protein